MAQSHDQEDPAEIGLCHPHQRRGVRGRLLQGIAYQERRYIAGMRWTAVQCRCPSGVRAPDMSINNLPLWAKSLLAPATMLVAMIALAGILFVYLARQETAVAELNDVAFEDLRQSMLATEAVTGFQTDLYHLTSTAANETDKPKIEAIAA